MFTYSFNEAGPLIALGLLAVFCGVASLCYVR
jgi:hypothetical protein